MRGISENTKALLALVGIIAIVFALVYIDRFLPSPIDATANFTVDFENNPDAAVVLEEFSDYQCPFCAIAHPQLLRTLRDFNGQLDYRYYHLPAKGDLSFRASLASECAREQGDFLTYSTHLFDRQRQLSDATFLQIARTLELDEKQFLDCYTGEKYAARVSADFELSKSRQVLGTPSFFVNGELVLPQQLYDAVASVAATFAADESAGEQNVSTQY